jgi:hypothetical protein
MTGRCSRLVLGEHHAVNNTYRSELFFQLWKFLLEDAAPQTQNLDKRQLGMSTQHSTQGDHLKIITVLYPHTHTYTHAQTKEGPL